MLAERAEACQCTARRPSGGLATLTGLADDVRLDSSLRKDGSASVGRKRPWRPEDELFDWFTVSYKSLYISVAVAVALAAGGGLHYYLTHATAAPAVPARPPQHATFSWLEGRVTVKAAGAADWVAATTRLLLKKNDVVRTAVASMAEITFFDGTVVHLRADSLITLEETSPDAGSPARLGVAWHISSGEVRVETGERAGSSGAVVSTPTSRGTLRRGSAAGIRVAPTGASDIRVFHGGADVVSRAGQHVPLSGAQGVRVAASGEAGPRVSLPPAPTIVTSREVTVAVPGPAGSLKLDWTPVGEAASYHFVLDLSTHFNWPLVDRRGVKDPSIELRGLDAGRYYWRVAAVADDLEGDFSEYGRLVVAPPASGPPASPPPLVLEAVDLRGTILHVRGRTEPGALVTLSGQPAEVGSDGGFDEFLTLDTAGPHDVIVRATGIDGGVAEERRTVVVTGF